MERSSKVYNMHWIETFAIQIRGQALTGTGRFWLTEKLELPHVLDWPGNRDIDMSASVAENFQFGFELQQKLWKQLCNSVPEFYKAVNRFLEKVVRSENITHKY